jgi:DNA-binding winged helix-turn-helix (wHTH) protein
MQVNEAPMSTGSAPALIDLAHEPAFELGGVEVRPSTREVVIVDRIEVLEPRIMQVLVALARRRGVVVSRNDLVEACWGGRVVGEDSIHRGIAGVRRLGQACGGFSVETVVRVGYRLSEQRKPDQAPQDLPASVAPGQPSDKALSIGSVFNQIFEVRRFIWGGPECEVYEGANITTQERVAIKVMLPHLSDDPRAQFQFRREANILVGLHHPAIAQYRMAAQEPSLGAFYIVTEFIDGADLNHLIGQASPPEGQLRTLIRRLCEGLKAAHDLGVVHRCLTPAAILAPAGRLDLAKIVDFGAAADSGGSLTDANVAEHLTFAAPEQLGDFNSQPGPWTDVYSLGLVMLSLATGDRQTLATTVEQALAQRRRGPDLASAPAPFHALFSGMLAADPKLRFRSMDEVLAALGAT